MEPDNLGGVAKFQLTFQAVEDLYLPAYKGSLFHGSFGHALMEIAPSWYHYFFPPDSGGPLPYVLLPSLDDKTHYPKGHIFGCELTLIGKSAHHFALCQSAFEYLGRRMGLGKNLGKFRLTGVSVASTSQSQPTLDEYIAASGVSPQEIIKNRANLAECKEITFHFITHLRLKDKNRLCGNVPPFSIFFARLAGRLANLSRTYGRGAIISKPEIKELVNLAQEISIKSEDVEWNDWKRFSGRQKSWMKFGGLRGSVTYSGDFSPFIPFLALGEWLHVGGKTSFGLGKYVMEGGEAHNVKSTP